MNGVLVIDKPRGLTSHDVVAVARRALKERRIGHTGTLDPLATGVLPLAVGTATRLVRFLTASDKDYLATIRFGVTTDSYDVTGRETSRTDTVPSVEAVAAALTSLSGEYLQLPPAFSAKKVDGRRAYDLARRAEPVTLRPVPVRVSALQLLELRAGSARIRLTCSAGFYVRSFAHSLGELTGSGACLEALQRTRSGQFNLEAAVSVEALGQGSDLMERLVPLDRLLPDLPAVELTARGRARVAHGRELVSGDFEHTAPETEWARLLDASGTLVALATPGRTPGALHPSVVLV